MLSEGLKTSQNLIETLTLVAPIPTLSEYSMQRRYAGRRTDSKGLHTRKQEPIQNSSWSWNRSGELGRSCGSSVVRHPSVLQIGALIGWESSLALEGFKEVLSNTLDRIILVLFETCNRSVEKPVRSIRGRRLVWERDREGGNQKKNS